MTDICPGTAGSRPPKKNAEKLLVSKKLDRWAEVQKRLSGKETTSLAAFKPPCLTVTGASASQLKELTASYCHTFPSQCSHPLRILRNYFFLGREVLSTFARAGLDPKISDFYPLRLPRDQARGRLGETRKEKGKRDDWCSLSKRQLLRPGLKLMFFIILRFFSLPNLCVNFEITPGL
jgi:hypothetical protein